MIAYQEKPWNIKQHAREAQEDQAQDGDAKTNKKYLSQLPNDKQALTNKNV